MIAAPAKSYVYADEHGKLRIAGTSYKFLPIIEGYVANALTAEQLVENHDQLTLATAHGILAYYHENKSAIDREIEARVRHADEMAARHPNPFTQAELEARLRERRGSQ
jgi:uncharacterized protein (DUF433 family)